MERKELFSATKDEEGKGHFQKESLE